MKIAEALVRIKDLKGRCAELQRIIASDSKFDLIDDMEVPSIQNEINEFEKLSREISNLKTQITKTNSEHGLTQMIHDMEHFRSCVSKFEPLTRNKQHSVELRTVGFGETAQKIHTHATYDVEVMKDTVDIYRENVRKLDLKLQRLNWEIDLVE